MDKAIFFQGLLEKLYIDVISSVNASKYAADYATNYESRAESQWDTQTLEASYLAAGQATQARQWADAIKNLQSEREDLHKIKYKVSLGALFSYDVGDAVEYFFFATTACGQTVKVNGYVIIVITAQSPLATILRGFTAGQNFILPNGSSEQVLTVQ